MPLRRGFTLIEMVVVLAVFVLLLGLSAGAYLTFRKDMEVRGAAGRITALIQAAHNSALSERQRTFIVEENIFVSGNLERSRISSFGLKTVGLWHFDDEDKIVSDGVSSGYGGDIQVQGAVPVQGRIGSGLKLDVGSLTCPANPDFSPPEGVAAEMWVKFARTEEISPTVGDCTLISLGTAYRFYVEGSRLCLQMAGQKLQSQTDDGSPYYLLPDRWLLLSFGYDAYTRRLALYVDRVERGHLDLGDDFLLPEETSDLTVASGLQGVVDEVKLMGVLESAGYVLPGGLALDIPRELAGSVPYIRRYDSGDESRYIKITAFDDKGWLDPMMGGSATIGFYNYFYPADDASRRTFLINRQGVLESQGGG